MCSLDGFSGALQRTATDLLSCQHYTIKLVFINTKLLDILCSLQISVIQQCVSVRGKQINIKTKLVDSE